MIDNCPACDDPLHLHIGGEPCTGGPVGSQESYAERRARAVREQKRKQIVRLFGEDTI